MSNELSPGTGRTIRDALHEVRSRLGAIRLAVTSLPDARDDVDFAASLIETADRESLRLGAELSALSALVRASTDPEEAAPCEVSGTLGVDQPVRVLAPPEVVTAALDALVRLCGDAGDVTVDVTTDDEHVRLRFAGPHADATIATTIGRALIAAIGTPDPEAPLGVVLRRAP